MTYDATAALLQALQDHGCAPKQSGGSWSARCPNHDDQLASLSLGRGDKDCAVVDCHAGCHTNDVIAALGLTMRDLFDNRDEPRNRREAEATYPYTDADGVVVFTKTRWRPPAQPKYTIAPKDAAGSLKTKPLYRLPELAPAINAGTTIYLVEGEKDADNAVAAGVVATTDYLGASKPGMAQKWRPEYADQLAGGHLVVVPDRDPSGYARAQAIVAALSGRVASLTVLEAAEGKDLTDHLQAGHTIEDLVPVADLQVALDAAVAKENQGKPATETKVKVEAKSSLDRKPVTQVWQALRLVEHLDGTALYVAAWKKWLRWDGTRWAEDVKNTIQASASKHLRDTTLKAFLDPDASPADVARYLKLQTAGGVAGTVRLASSEPDVAAAPDDFNTGRDWLNCANGTLDLRTAKIHEHDPRQLITKVTRAGLDPGAACPEFEKFLTKVLPDQEVREFLARLLGYALSGHVLENILPILQGTGRNGKSTLINTVMYVMGDYVGAASPHLLTERGAAAHPTEQADLYGKRMAFCQETDRGDRLAEATVKWLTGGDRMSVRRMYENPWEFDPSHTLFLVTNYPPIVVGDDLAIWRRLFIIPFDVTITQDEEDPSLAAKLRGEAAGILAWMVKGHLEYRARGLDAPPAVRAATDAYRDGEDELGRFVTDRLVVTPSLSVQSSVLFKTWREWCQTEGVQAGSNKAFTLRLVKHGYGPAKQDSRGRMVWRGLGLGTDAE